MHMTFFTCIFRHNADVNRGSCCTHCIPEIVLERIAVPHILVWECIRSHLTVVVVFLDTVVAQVNAPRQEKHI